MKISEADPAPFNAKLPELATKVVRTGGPRRAKATAFARPGVVLISTWLPVICAGHKRERARGGQNAGW
jgi:hypothetical protein